MQYRQVEVTAAAAHEILHKMAYQHLAHAEPLGLAVCGQAPEAGALVRIIVGPGMVEPHHGAYDLTAVGILGQPELRPAGLPGCQPLGVDLHHAGGQVEVVDRLPVLLALRTADMKAAHGVVGRPVVGEPQTHGVRRVEKQLLRGEGQHHMGVGHVEGDVALAGGFLQQTVGQPLRVAEGVADQQPPPAAVEGDLGQAVLRLLALLGMAGLQTFPGGGLAAAQALLIGGKNSAHQGVTPWVSSQSSRTASCHSREPRSGVIWAAGSCNSRST